MVARSCSGSFSRSGAARRSLRDRTRVTVSDAGWPGPLRDTQYVKQADDLIRLSAALSDESKSIAEYWADGPGTETPAGHWILIGAYCAERDGMPLEQNVKMFFALANALFDAGSCLGPQTGLRLRPAHHCHQVLYQGRPIEAWGGREGALQ